MYEMNASSASIVISHNDFLKLLVETGVIGLALYFAVWWDVVRRVIATEVGYRSVFFAIVAAVGVMNILSNSYVSRVGLAQMLFLMLSYLYLRNGEKVNG
jgi:O-antigen ligase